LSSYERLGVGYRHWRRPDRRIAAQIHAAIGPVGPVLNVGAGAGSYEPVKVPVVAVEPSLVMLDQRPAGSAPAVRSSAEALPFPDGRFAAGMAILTVHHWTDPAQGLRELRRVVRGPVAVLSWDAVIFNEYWMVTDYVPASTDLDTAVPPPTGIAEHLGGGRIDTVPVPADCTDGFYAAWWRRPEAYLNPAVRAAISGLARLDPADVEPGIEMLRRDLADGTWFRRHGDLLALDTFDAGYRLVVSDPRNG
jgi:SAM-dependent methyltransferase